MPNKDIAYIDKKGRLLIPQALREALNMGDGEKVIIELDQENRMLKIEPSHEKRLLKLKIALADSPGSLASAAAALAKLGVDLVSTQSHSARRGEAAVWEVECNPKGASVGKIKAAMGRVGAEVASVQWE